MLLKYYKTFNSLSCFLANGNEIEFIVGLYSHFFCVVFRLTFGGLIEVFVGWRLIETTPTELKMERVEPLYVVVHLLRSYWQFF